MSKGVNVLEVAEGGLDDLGALGCANELGILGALGFLGVLGTVASHLLVTFARGSVLFVGDSKEKGVLSVFFADCASCF